MDSAKRLKELGKMMKGTPVNSPKYKKILKEIDTILGMPAELERLDELDEEEPEESD